MHQYTHLLDNPHFLERGHMSHAGLGWATQPAFTSLLLSALTSKCKCNLTIHDTATGRNDTDTILTADHLAVSTVVSSISVCQVVGWHLCSGRYWSQAKHLH